MTFSAPPIEVVSAGQAFDLLRAKLIGNTRCDKMALDCAHLRACVWVLSNGVKPVHVLRILNLAVDTSPFYCKGDGDSLEKLRFRLRDALDELSEVGDLIVLENGWWLPAPLRCVPLGIRAGYRLLVGGVPTHLLGSELADRIEHHAAFRRTRGVHVQKELDLTEEAYDSWVGYPPSDLKEWAEGVFSVPMETYSEPRGGARLHVYDPIHATKNAPQHFRWRDQRAGLTGRFLVCKELPFGLRQYFIADIRGGLVTGMVAPDLGLGDIRRLMYALDSMHGNPVAVVQKTHGQKKRFVLKSEIPAAERRVFAATGRLEGIEESYYPQIWDFTDEHAGSARERLLDLGIKITGE